MIEDDIYGELDWSGQRPRPLRHFDTHANVITCGSFSKILSPGLRVGWLLGGDWTDALVRAKYFSTVGSASLPQLALADYLAQHDLERHLRKLRRTWPTTANACAMRSCGIGPKARGWATRPVDSRCGCNCRTVKVDKPCSKPHWPKASAPRRAICTPAAATTQIIYASTCGQPWSDTLERAMRRLGKLAAQVAR